MSSSEDIMITAKLKDDVSTKVDRIQSKFKGMAGTISGKVSNAMSNISGKITDFSKEAIQSAMTAEAEWARFGAAVDAGGGNWEKQSSEVKKWCRDFSDSMGRATGDTRAAMTNFMNYGMSLEQSQSAMKATAGVAAAMGATEEEASNAVIQACNGRGMALKKLGFNMDDYKDSVTGAIDKERLLNDLQAKFGGSAEKYAQTATAKFQVLQNTIASLKTEFGAAMMDALTPLIPVVKGIFDAFNKLPAPVKTGAFLILGLVAAIGMLAGPVSSLISIFTALGIIAPAAGTGVATAGTEAGAASAGFWSLSASLFGVEIPLWLIIAAILAVIAVVYLVGQYFGLWNDPMEMCTVILGTLANVLTTVAGILMGIFTQAWNTISGAITAAYNILMTIWNALTGFATGQITIQQIIITVWTALSTMFGAILMNLLNRVVAFAAQFVAKAVSMAQRFVSGLIGGITSLPSRVWGIFMQVVQMIQNAAQQAGQAAQNVANAIWNGITGKLGELASWLDSNVGEPIRNVASAVGGLLGAAGGEGLAKSAREAGTYIGTGYLGRTAPSTSTKKTSKSTVNVGEINLKLSDVTDQQAKHILVQALDGLDQIKEVKLA